MVNKFIFGIFIFFIIFTIVIAQPKIPHQFYGSVKCSNNNLVKDGTVVSARVDNIEVKSTITSNGEYGKQNPFFVWVSDDNAIIDFHVDNIYDISETFQEGVTQNLDLLAPDSSCSTGGGNGGNGNGGSGGSDKSGKSNGDLGISPFGFSWIADELLNPEKDDEGFDVGSEDEPNISDIGPTGFVVDRLSDGLSDEQKQIIEYLFLLLLVAALVIYFYRYQYHKYRKSLKVN